MKKKLGSVILAFCMCLVSLFTPVPAFAETEDATVLVIRIGDQIYENVTNGSSIIGDFDLNDLEFWVESVNGNKLENVGSKSTAKDSQGRNPLEIASVPGDGRVAVTLIYHAADDPVAANQAYGFSVAGIVFANSESGLDIWHFGDYYNQVPTLSDEWIHEDSSNVDRCLAVKQATAGFQFYCDILVNNRATRLLPLYSVPGLIDHN